LSSAGGGVRYERIGSAAVLSIDRPERRNAVDGPTAEALRDGLARFEADDDARVLVLTGAGGEAFCAGADLKALDTLAPRIEGEDGPLGFSRVTPPSRRSRRCPAGASPEGSSSRPGATFESRPRGPPSAAPSAGGACR